MDFSVRVRDLTREEVRQLRESLRDTSWFLPRVAKRLQVIYLSSCGLSTYQISIAIGMGRNNVGCWIRRFNQVGLEGLEDLPRSGRPRKKSPE